MHPIRASLIAAGKLKPAVRPANAPVRADPSAVKARNADTHTEPLGYLEKRSREARSGPRRSFGQRVWA